MIREIQNVENRNLFKYSNVGKKKSIAIFFVVFFQKI